MRMMLIALCSAIALLLFPARHQLSGPIVEPEESSLNPTFRNVGLIAILAVLTDSTLRIVLLISSTVLLFIVVPWLERRPDKQEQIARDSEFPRFLDYLHMCLESGLSISDSLIRIEANLGGRLAIDVNRINELYRLGAPINEAVELVALEHSTWQRLSEIVTRSYHTGASVKESVRVISNYLRATGETQALSRIRALAVKCTLPLGLCFLPAFVFLAIVPVIASLYKSMF